MMRYIISTLTNDRHVIAMSHDIENIFTCYIYNLTIAYHCISKLNYENRTQKKKTRKSMYKKKTAAFPTKVKTLIQFSVRC